MSILATRLSLLGGTLLLVSGCNVIDAGLIGASAASPTVVVHTPGPGELGVSTEYGVVFLGRGAKSGDVEFTVWFADGPSLETGIIESIGSNLFVTQAEILLPTTDLAFDTPPVGESVLVRGRGEGGPYRFRTQVVSDERIEGLLLSTESSPPELDDSQIGAGVYVDGPGGPALIGLLAGRLRLEGTDGAREYFAVVGADDLWRLVAHGRRAARPRHPPYRGDVTP